jgi:hypothetical protein
VPYPIETFKLPAKLTELLAPAARRAVEAKISEIAVLELEDKPDTETWRKNGGPWAFNWAKNLPKASS